MPPREHGPIVVAEAPELAERPSAPPYRRYYWNSFRINWLLWLAIDSD